MHLSLLIRQHIVCSTGYFILFHDIKEIIFSIVWKCMNFHSKLYREKKIKNALIIQAEIKALSVEKTCIKQNKTCHDVF